MNRAEHLLSIVAEEAVEVAQRATKALRFGMDEVQPDQPHNNWQRIEHEFHDLLAALEMTHGRPLTIRRDLIDAKKAKVEKFLAYSAELGTLTGSAGNAGVDSSDPAKCPFCRGNHPACCGSTATRGVRGSDGGQR